MSALCSRNLNLNPLEFIERTQTDETIFVCPWSQCDGSTTCTIWKRVDEILIKFMLRLSTRSSLNKHAKHSLRHRLTSHGEISVIFCTCLRAQISIDTVGSATHYNGPELTGSANRFRSAEIFPCIIELRWKCSKTSLIQLHGWISSAAFLLLLLFRFNVFSLHSFVYLCPPVIVNVARRSCSTVCPFWIETVSTEHRLECNYYIIIYSMPSSAGYVSNICWTHTPGRGWGY